MARLSDLVRDQGDSSRDSGPGRAEQGGGASPPSRPIDPDATPATGSASGPDWYKLAMDELARFEPVFQQGTLGNLGELPRIADGIAESLLENDRLLAQVYAGSPGRQIITNSVNVAILATRLGMGLGYGKEELGRVALGALLHDVGMFNIPDTIINQPQPLSASDREVIEQHPEVGAEIVATLGSSYGWLKQVAAQEHERWNGQGYPNGLAGGEIHPHAQLVGVADVFDALISPRPYRRRLAPHEAIRELLVREKTAFSRVIIKALVEQLSMYPLGTCVRLNTGEVGVVTGSKSSYPLRPIIQMGTASDGEAGGAKIVDLSTSTLVHIVEVVKPVEVTT